MSFQTRLKGKTTDRTQSESIELELEKRKLMRKITTLRNAHKELRQLVDVLMEFLNLPRAGFAERALSQYEYEKDIKDLLQDIERVAKMIDEMPNDVREYLDNVLIELMQTANKIDRRIYELELQVGRNG